MDRSRQRKVALAWGFLLAALVLNVIVTQRSLDRSVRPVDAASEWFFLPPTPLLRGLAMGYDHAVADYLWIKTMWFLGDPDFGGRDYATLARMLDVVTDLKPRFYYLYRLGGSYLGFGPDGARAAVALLGKGREAYPDDWMMPFLMGFNYFYHLKDPGNAATYFAEAAKIPGSPRYLGALAARLHAQAHDTRAALMLLAQVAKAEPDPAIQARYVERIRALEAELAAEEDARGRRSPSIGEAAGQEMPNLGTEVP